jgi:hypothetical protein
LTDKALLKKQINVTVQKGRPLTIRRALENYYSPKSWNNPSPEIESRGTQIMKVYFFFNFSFGILHKLEYVLAVYCYSYTFVVVLSSCPYAANSVTLLPTASAGNALSFLPIRTFGLLVPLLL